LTVSVIYEIVKRGLAVEAGEALIVESLSASLYHIRSEGLSTSTAWYHIDLVGETISAVDLCTIITLFYYNHGICY